MLYKGFILVDGEKVCMDKYYIWLYIWKSMNIWIYKYDVWLRYIWEFKNVKEKFIKKRFWL